MNDSGEVDAYSALPLALLAEIAKTLDARQPELELRRRLAEHAESFRRGFASHPASEQVERQERAFRILLGVGS